MKSEDSFNLFAARLQARRVTRAGLQDLIVGCVLTGISLSEPTVSPERVVFALVYTVLALPWFRQRYRLLVMHAWVVSAVVHVADEASAAWVLIGILWTAWSIFVFRVLWSDPSPRAAQREVDRLSKGDGEVQA